MVSNTGEDDWRLRQKREPLTEIFQIKGSQECALGVGATDEECAFAQVLDPCQPGETTGCAFQTGFVRQGMKVGLELEQELGFNPLQNGFVAATDSHNSNPGDVEEWDFRGSAGTVQSPALRRLRVNNFDGKAYRSMIKFNTSRWPSRSMGPREHPGGHFRRARSSRNLCHFGAAHRAAL